MQNPCTEARHHTIIGLFIYIRMKLNMLKVCTMETTHIFLYYNLLLNYSTDAIDIHLFAYHKFIIFLKKGLNLMLFCFTVTA